jgi:hypothetical protein
VEKKKLKKKLLSPKPPLAPFKSYNLPLPHQKEKEKAEPMDNGESSF